MTLGQYLKKRRTDLGLTGEYVASKMGVNKSSYHAIENGEAKKFSHKLVEPLCQTLGISPLVIINWGDVDNDRDVLELPYYDYAASAGTGNYLLCEGYDFEFKEFTNVPHNAEFALRIKGDSMLPAYEDGDIVFVRTNVVVEFGQVGIFILNNESYLKQWGNGKLISLNPKYAPIAIGEYDEFRIVGRVVGKAEGDV